MKRATATGHDGRTGHPRAMWMCVDYRYGAAGASISPVGGQMSLMCTGEPWCFSKRGHSPKRQHKQFAKATTTPMAVIRNEPDPATTPLGSPEPQFSISPVRPCFRLPEARVGDWGWSLFLFFFFKKKVPEHRVPRIHDRTVRWGFFFFHSHDSAQQLATDGDGDKNGKR